MNFPLCFIRLTIFSLCSFIFLIVDYGHDALIPHALPDWEGFPSQFAILINPTVMVLNLFEKDCGIRQSLIIPL